MRVRDTGYDGRTRFKVRKDGDEDGQVDVSCFPESSVQHGTAKKDTCGGSCWGLSEKVQTAVEIGIDMYNPMVMSIGQRHVASWWWRHSSCWLVEEDLTYVCRGANPWDIQGHGTAQGEPSSV